VGLRLSGGRAGGLADDVLRAVTTVTDSAMSSRHDVMSHSTPTELALGRLTTVQRQPVVQPDLTCGRHQPVHHGDAVMRCRSNAQKLLATRNRRVVDRLQVDTVLGHQLVS